ncbi:MAG: Ig-like domain-containing protein, partial [Pseudomonadota bacterium]
MPLFPFGFPFGRSLVFGTPGDDTLPSGPGSNVIFGFGGNDTLFSSAANNILFGNRGDDTFQYLAGADRFVGGSGHDTVVVSEGNLFDYLDDFPTLHVGRPTRQTEFTSAQTGETFRVSGVEAITFEAQDLTVFLDGTNNAVFAQDDEVRASGAGVTTFGLQEFKENDIDFDGDELQSFLLLSETGSNGGRATVNASGTVDFDADGDFDDLLIGQTAITTFTYTIDDGRGGAGLATISITVEGEAEPIEARINEIHYDNVSLDVGEFVEIRTSAGADASDLVVELYNGTTGAVYSTSALGDVETDDAISVRSDGVFDYYVIELPTNGIQNGSPDGLALSNDGALIEFLSYEGSFVAVGGAADGATSVDIGVEETGSTPVGFSLQRLEGDLWDAPRADTRGAANTVVAAVFLNEIAVSTTGSPDFEFFEIFGAAGTSLDGYSLIQVEAGTAFNPGNILTVVSLDGQVIGEDGFFLAASPEAEADFGVVGDLQIPDDSFENFDSTVLLVRDFDGGEGTDLDANDDGLIDAELQIVDGVALADSGPSIFYGGVPVVGPDGTFLAAGAKRIEDGSGDFVQTSFSSTGDYTPGSTNTPAGEAVLISAIQGAGDASPLVGETVVVEAVVTAIVDGGFFLQEEEDDGDGNAATSEGIFVSGDSSAVSVGDLVEVTGTVEESFGRTQIALSTASVVMSGVALPAAAAILVGPEAADYEAVEGMRVSVSSATDDPLTITANFNFDRFGELQISAGNKRQPTQQFDPQDEAAEVAALAEANANNTLLLDDGVSAQNPTEFRYVPVPEEFDNGNGFLDTGDDFGGEDGLGATLRLGTEITAPIEGVMDFSFGDYKVIPTTLLEIDESTNSGARPELEDVGGDLQVVSANVLNYFATLDIGDAGVGPGELDPRGADSQSELDRQTDKLVAQLLATEGEVFALQELGNDGFGADGSVSVLTQGLNAERTIDYAFVDP